MFINDISNPRNLQCIVLQELRNHGVKYRLKKSNCKSSQNVGVLFGAALTNVPQQTVTCCDTQLQIPVMVHEVCSMLKSHAHLEGLFRKAGSQTRQREIKRVLENGGRIDKSCHAVDIAGILKLYLRALPEPLIGSDLQELFLRCLLLSDSLRLSAIQNAFLLLPIPYLHLLHYIMEFFRFISSKSDMNRMDANNLAIVLTPSVMPLPSSYLPQRMEQHVRFVKLLIENSSVIGCVPESVVLHLDDDLEREDEQRQKKKRRSGSLTRMLNGLRKMVSGSSSNSHKTPTPDILMTPIISKADKRKQEAHQGLSAKKRKEILNNLPQKTLACTPVRVIGDKEHKKLRLSIGRKSKDKIFNYNALQTMPQNCNLGGKSSKSEASIPDFPMNLELENKKNDLSKRKESDYVRIPKSEYEAIKNRVSAIENRISQEFNVITSIEHNSINEPVKQVQTEYEKTLEEAANLASPRSDQLAKRLSRELKIRQSDEHKIIRSPSARKIGTIRRRSRENDRKLTRTQTWNASSLTSMQSLHSSSSSSQFYPQINLKRGRPNTINTGLIHPSPITNSNSNIDSDFNNRRLSVHDSNAKQSMDISPHSYGTRNNFKRASSFHGNFTIVKPPLEVKEQIPHNDGTWKTANSFLTSIESLDNPMTGRASVAKLRSQNAGMVLAKARLFDGMTDSDTSLEKKVISKPVRHTGFARKPRKCDRFDSQNKQLSTVLTDTDTSSSMLENKHLKKVYKSPGYVSKRGRSRQIRSPVTVARMKENLNLSSQLKDVIYDVCTPMSEKISIVGPENISTPTHKTKENIKVNGSYKTPRNTPPIKKPLSVKSSKAFKVTQLAHSEMKRVNTPLRANHSTPRRQSPRLLSVKARQQVVQH